jgi:hypothetical protein
MRAVFRITAAGLAIASLGLASAASAATDSAQVEAEILTALTVTVDANADTLDFGAIAESGTGGTVTVSPTNAQTCSAGLVCDGNTAVPNFDIQGVAGSVVNISVVNASETLTGPGAATMAVNAFTLSTNQVTLDGTGAGDFDVGGTLTVAAAQAPGTYNGTLTVEVIYN